MSDEKIEVEWIATANKMMQTLDRMDQRFDKQDQALKKLAQTSDKTANSAAGSFNKLEQELKENEAALRRIEIGSKAFDEQRKKVDALRKSFQNVKGEIGSIGQASSGMLSAGIAKIGALAAGMASFQAVVTAVVAELDKVRQLKLDAAATTRTFEQSLADVGQNIGADAVPQAREMILENAPRLGTTNEGLANLIGVAISAGAKDITQAMELSAATLKLTVGDADKAQALVSGALDVASLSGSDNFEGALGQLLQVQSQVRSTNLSEFTRNIGSGLAAATAGGANVQGVSTERGFELASVISQIIKDATGSETSTSLRQLIARLDAFSPLQEKTLKDKTVSTVSTESIEKLRQARTVDDRMAVIQGDEGLQRQFLDTIEESIGKVAIREIITQSDRAVGFEQKASQAILPIDDAQKFFTDLNETIGVGAPTLRAERVSQANIASAEITGGRAIAGQVQKIVEDTISKVNLSGLDYDTSTMLMNNMRGGEAIGADPIAAGIDTLERAKQRRMGFGVIPIGGAVSEEDKALIQSQIEALKALEATIRAGQQPQPAAPRPAAPAVRPKEAPLPAATAP